MSEARGAGAGWEGLTSRPSSVIGFYNDLFVQEGRIMNGLMSQSLEGTQTAAVCSNVICTSLCQLLWCYSMGIFYYSSLKILPRLSVKCLATRVLWEHVTLNDLGARPGLA